MFKSLFTNLLTHMGTIALLALLAYVVYCEFIRPSASRQQLADATALAASALAESRQARAELDTARQLVQTIEAHHQQIIDQATTLLIDVQALNDSLTAHANELVAKEAELEKRYKGQKRRVQQTQKLVM
ncbi:hypothetical protein [Fibrella aquatilis]|uniref:Uncharacterized protein n=1 Tax=Fibrella aquatilis TaxID=2817059 RepID=A0A939G5X5_9BACT|nr:hypothetical protein [Fibrella aquatilis]MBO0930378.1 hypothetical protein [Fibrella aquatilis]